MRNVVSFVLLVLLPTILRGEEPVAQAEGKLADIIKKIKENEKLYENIEVVMKESYDIGERKSSDGRTDFGKLHEVIRVEKQTRFVSQGEWFRLETKGSSETSQGTTSRDRIRSFDGETTRVFDQNAIGNISKERLEDEAFVRPHTLAIRYIDLPAPFSVYLSGDEAIRAYPNASWPEDLRLQVTYEGEEKYKDLICHKIVVTSLTKSDYVSTRTKFWLAEDRNYLPIQRVLYTPLRSNDIANNQTVMSDLREIKPGIWFPFDVETTAYNKFAIEREGRQELQWRERYVVEKAELNPQYDRAFFTRVEFPEGTAMYEVVKGVIKRSWRHGAPGEPESP